MSAVDLLYPLSLFYRQAQTVVPEARAIDGSEIPQPLRQLLVHKADMTPTLEAYYGSPIRLNLLLVQRHSESTLMRQVVLETDESRPVEFGAIWIDLDCFDYEPRKLVTECCVPLGTILGNYEIEHSCRPSAYVMLTADDVMCHALHLDAPVQLYGRRNTLIDPRGRPIAEVVEILAPCEESA